nr:sodium dependent phosphate transporter [Hymenolepis microstoma]
MLEETELLLVVVGFLIAFVSAFGLGANDVANSFGTSVGSKVLTLRQACILATICEIAGSVLLGGHVSATIRGGIIDPNQFNGTEDGAMRLMQGQVSSLIGSCTWMLLATFLRIPVSATHSIVGATTGFGLVLFGIEGIQWKGILKIVGSWFLSPVLSGLVSSCIYLIIKYTVLVKENSLEPALNTLPFLYAVTIFINVFSVLFGGLKMLNLPEISIWTILGAAAGCAIVAGLVVHFIGRPIIRRKVHARLSGEANTSSSKKTFNLACLTHCRKRIEEFFSHETNAAAPQANSRTETTFSPKSDVDVEMQDIQATEEIKIAGSSKVVGRDGQVCDRPEEAEVFAFAQILTATFGSFVHGGNDVANAIGPVMGLWMVATTGDVLMKVAPKVWILFYGGIGISVGLWVWGRKVMQTIGHDLTEITPTTGMCIELGAAITVLIASKAGLPISTTHCLVGSVVFVGCFRERQGVNWRLFLGIAFAWMVTLPVSCGISSLAMYLFTVFG